MEFNLKEHLKSAWNLGLRSAGEVQRYVETKLLGEGHAGDVMFAVVTDAAGQYLGLKFAVVDLDGKIHQQDGCILPCDRYFWDTDGVILGPSFIDAANLLGKCIDHVPVEIGVQIEKILFNLKR